MIKFIILILSIFLIINNNIINCQLPPGYGFGLVDPNALCTNYIGDPIDQKLCGDKLPNKESIYTSLNKTTQYINLKIVEGTYKKFTFLQNQQTDRTELNYAQFGICSVYFPKCITTSPTVTPVKNITLAQRLCKSVCEKMVLEVPALGASLNCSDTLKFPQIATLYNLTNYGFTANGGLYPVPCVDPTTAYNNNPGDMIEICPSPLTLRNSSDPNYSADRGYTYLTPTNCVLGCPAPWYPKNKWGNMYTMSKIVSTISFVCSIYNVITFGLLNHRRSKYNYCITFFSLSVVIINLMDIVTYSIGYEKVLCPEVGRSAVQDDIACGLTASLFHLAISNGVFWWVTMAIQLYLVVKRLKLFNFRYFIIFNTILSIVTLIIPLGGNAFSAGSGSLGCWVRKTAYVNAVFWIPCGIALLLGSICIILVIVEIYRISKSVSKDSKMLMLQIKPFLCVTLVGGSFFYLFIFNFHNERKKDSYKQSIPAYVTCLLTNGDDSECYSKGPDYGAYFLFYFFIRLFGILFFCIYGTSKNARDIWIHSNLLNHPKVKPFLLKYINYNSQTIFGSATNQNSKTNGGNNSKKHNANSSVDNSSFSRSRNTIELENNGNSIISKSCQDIETGIDETKGGDDSSNSSGNHSSN